MNNIEYEIVNINIDTKEQAISQYSYGEDDKLNKDLSEFILDKTKLLPINKPIQFNFHTKSNIKKSEIETPLKNHFKQEYLELRAEVKRLSIFALIMLILGSLAIFTLFLIYNYFDNRYFETLLEVTVWVFIWEAIDSFFLKQSHLRRQCKHYKNLYQAKIIVSKIK